MSEQKKYKSASVAAEWWSSKLNGNAKQDIGTDDGIISALMMMVAMKNIPSFEQVSAFKEKLTQRINSELSLRGRMLLSVDYGAEGLLAETAHECGIYCGLGGVFPSKTTMSVTRDEVEVKYGYGAPFQKIYEKEKEDIRDKG